MPVTPEQLRSLAAALLATADAADDIGNSISSTSGGATVDKADAYIRAHPGAIGDEVTVAIGLASAEHFRRSIVPKLKRRGFTSSRGAGGYFPPQEREPL